MATPTYELIETTTLASSASSVSFSSITQDYRDLVVVIDLPLSASSVTAYIKLNGSGVNYSLVGMEGSGSGITSFTISPSGIESAVGISSGGGNAITQIMDYTQTDKHKTALVRQNTVTNAVRAYAARWADTSAVTSIDIDGSNDFQSGSTFSLYGIA